MVESDSGNATFTIVSTPIDESTKFAEHNGWSIHRRLPSNHSDGSTLYSVVAVNTAPRLEQEPVVLLVARSFESEDAALQDVISKIEMECAKVG